MKSIARLAFLVAPLLIAACGGDQGDDSSAPGTGVKPCAEGTYPALFAVEKKTAGSRWTYCTPEPAYFETVAATAESVYALTSAGRQRVLVAVDAAKGAERWRATVTPALVPVGPFAGGGVVTVVTDGEVVGLDATTGAERWRVPAEGLTPLALTEKVVLLGGNGASRGLRGLDRGTGRELWRSDFLVQDLSGVGVLRSPAAVLKDTVVLPTMSFSAPKSATDVPVQTGVAVAIDVRTGAEVWRATQLDHPAAADGVVIGSKGRIIEGPPTGGPPERVIEALDASSGKLLWSAPGWPSYGDVWALGDGAVFAMTPDGIVAYDLRDGSIRWSLPRPMGEPWAAADGTVFMGWEGFAAAVSSKDGKSLWTLSPSWQGTAWMTGLVVGKDTAFISISSLPPAD